MRSRRVSAKRAAPGKGPDPALGGAGRARPVSSMGFLAAPQPAHHPEGRGQIQALTRLDVFLGTGGSVEVSDGPLALTISVQPVAARPLGVVACQLEQRSLGQYL